MAEEGQTRDNPGAPNPTPGKAKRRTTHWGDWLDFRELARRARRARRRTYFLVALAALVVVLGALYYHFTNDETAKRMADKYLEELLGLRVSSGHADFSAFGEIRLEKVRLTPPPPFEEP
ncbi:MAG: hypothetical protein QGD94_01880, partial [Planctomycetia bacterium]|nr:hypothetical protein [Planctomycetia bacterium]